MLFTDPKTWWIECSPRDETDAIHQSQQCSTPYSQHIAYLNRLCLNACLPWLQEDFPAATAASATTLLSQWEVVNGTAIAIGSLRLILIPSEAIDLSELVVPQEWVDIPSWAGDYYLAVQVQADEGWVRVWGYATHEHLKNSGTYDSSDRTYCLDDDQLTQDLSALSVTIQLCGTLSQRSPVAALPELSPTHANNLIHWWGTPDVLFPRLAMPFEIWGALLEQDSWRQQLWQQRTGNLSPINIVSRLGEWLQGNVTGSWQAFEEFFSPSRVVGWRDRSSLPNVPSGMSSWVRVLDLGDPNNTASVALIVSLAQLPTSRVAIELQLFPLQIATTPPPLLQLQLLEDSGRIIAADQTVTMKALMLHFDGEPGERFQVRVSCGNRQVVDGFEI